uniref:Lectin-domain containing receptor kinase A4.3 n=1 Tax=Aegilops tauschii TaxID=37682 RepID=M8BID9_AEGTA
MPREFSYEMLRKATKNFDERLRLGKGGYGVVYKGTLPADAEQGQTEPTEVAVKKFIRDDARCVEDFVKEVDIINRLRHKNIVPLIGWCYKKGQLLLVYEYMPNGSLDQHLFRRGGVQEARAAPLSWASRYGIVADVASGLHYVHHEYGRTVLHRDIKASNVMLDTSFSARLGDFGLARVLQIVSKKAPPPEVPLFKPSFVWPPEGGAAHFSLSDIEMTTSSGGSFVGTGNGSSTRATQETSYDSFRRPPSAPNNSQEYFPALSSGR